MHTSPTQHPWRRQLRKALLLVCLFSSLPAIAHHAFTMFDRTRVVNLSGTVRTFQYTNPHAYLWLYVMNDKGTEDLWGIEFTSGPSGLERNGWSKDTLKKGDKVSIDINPLKDGRNGGTVLKVRLADGRILNTFSDFSEPAK